MWKMDLTIVLSLAVSVALGWTWYLRWEPEMANDEDLDVPITVDLSELDEEAPSAK